MIQFVCFGIAGFFPGLPTAYSYVAGKQTTAEPTKIRRSPSLVLTLFFLTMHTTFAADDGLAYYTKNLLEPCMIGIPVIGWGTFKHRVYKPGRPFRKRL